MKILAIDQGTTSTRALTFDEAGQYTPIASFSHAQSYPAPGRVEHDPAELLRNVRACIDAAAGLDDLAAIGLDNQGESCLAWDALTRQPVGPVIVWQDDRTRDTIARLEASGIAELVAGRAGLPLDPYFSASKLAWILVHNERARDLHAAGRLRMGTTDAFFLDSLAGRFVTDVSTASRTSLMNLRSCDWDPQLCEVFGVPVETLPEIVDTTGIQGLIECGDRMIPLSAMVTDQQAALYGHGCRQPGDAKITFGTGAFALALTNGPACGDGRGALPTVAWRKAGASTEYALDGGVYSASSAVNWARNLGLFSSFADISTFANAPACSRGMFFVPALAGLACPHWQRHARGSWFGLALDTGPGDMVQALLEGVAFRMAEVIGAMALHQEVKGPISIDGGMSANGYFCQFLANCLERELIVSEQSELTALGTALLAAEGAGQVIDAPVKGRIVSPAPLPGEYATQFAQAREMTVRFGKSVAGNRSA